MTNNAFYFWLVTLARTLSLCNLSFLKLWHPKIHWIILMFSLKWPHMHLYILGIPSRFCSISPKENKKQYPISLPSISQAHQYPIDNPYMCDDSISILIEWKTIMFEHFHILYVSLIHLITKGYPLKLLLPIFCLYPIKSPTCIRVYLRPPIYIYILVVSTPVKNMKVSFCYK